ncbi:vesicle-trafficking protein SEC22b-like [Corticium candelabrum]|uniref:vesicle-trafficking protein SEC22b-like n=1 Tax=Corticium candelabrum TaxID=121492 RepID=UPI002E2553E9|nr:vesicle-trafficking protein SEC22b-like [Corticium candelabrum]
MFHVIQNSHIAFHKVSINLAGSNFVTRWCCVLPGQSYIIEHGVCYLVLCEKSFPKRLAFNYLKDLAQEFQNEHQADVSQATRPYAFIEFETYINKAKKQYQDSRSRRHLNKLSDELQDVQMIMVQNIEEVLQRGEHMSELDSKANNLSSMSKTYKKEARFLNIRASLAKKIACGIILIIMVLFLRYWIF